MRNTFCEAVLDADRGRRSTTCLSTYVQVLLAGSGVANLCAGLQPACLWRTMPVGSLALAGIISADKATPMSRHSHPKRFPLLRSDPPRLYR